MIKEKRNEEINIGNGGLIYRMTKGEKQGVAVYGIEVECSLFGTYDITRVYDISTDSKIVKELLHILADYLVTPCSVRYVVEDYMEEKLNLEL